MMRKIGGLLFLLSLTILTGCSSTVSKELPFEKTSENTFKVKDGVHILGGASENKIIFTRNEESNVAYSYDLTTNKEELLVKSLNSKHAIARAFTIDDTYLVWVSMDKTPPGTWQSYTMGCQNLKTKESFVIDESVADASSIEPTMTLNPEEISFDSGIIAYKTMTIVQGKTIEEVKTFDLATKEKRIHHKSDDFYETSISNVSIKNGFISFCSSPKNNTKDKSSKLFYFDMNSEKRVLREELIDNIDMGSPYLMEDKLILVNYELSDISKSIFEEVDLSTGGGNVLFKEDMLSGLSSGSFPLVEWHFDNKLVLNSTLGTRVFDLKVGKEILLSEELLYVKKYGNVLVYGVMKDGEVLKYLKIGELLQ